MDQRLTERKSWRISTDGGVDVDTHDTTDTVPELRLSSSAFADGERIPTRHTCEGANASPELSIEQVPAGTESLALVFDDPDAPRAEPWVHWLCWNLAPATTTIPEGIPHGDSVLDGASQGQSDSGPIGYAGPCPPVGHGVHRYRFTLYALDTDLDVQPSASRATLEDAMAGHVVGRTQLTGTYERT